MGRLEEHPVTSSANSEIDEVFRLHGVADKQEALIATTERLFQVPPKLVLGEPDLGEPPYVVFHVRLPCNISTDFVRDGKSSWYDAVMDLMRQSAIAVRLVVGYE